MISFIFLFFVAGTPVFALNDRCHSDFTIGFFYKEMRCQPVHEEASLCPSHFDCSQYEARVKSGSTACNYEGRAYKIGSLIPAPNEPCLAQCKCLLNERTQRGEIQCANVECFNDEPESHNCTLLYSENYCCSVKKHCKGYGNLPTCLVDGKVYLEGEKFYPNEEPCKVCYCKAGFTGSFSKPFCHDIRCNIELHYTSKIIKNCTPVYYREESCCPIQWLCPSEQKGKEILPFKGTSPRTTQAKCKYGDIELRQFDELVVSDSIVKCKCIVPPLLTCTSL